MRIEIEELTQSINEELHMIAALSETLDVRVGALRDAAAAAEKIISDLETRRVPVAVRRQADGTIKVFVDDCEIWQMDEANAIATRDQLDVALHMPTPDQPINPPSKL